MQNLGHFCPTPSSGRILRNIGLRCMLHGNALDDSGRTPRAGPGAAQAGWPPGTQPSEHQGAAYAGSQAAAAGWAGARAAAAETQVQADVAVALRLLSRRRAGDGRGPV